MGHSGLRPGEGGTLLRGRPGGREGPYTAETVVANLYYPEENVLTAEAGVGGLDRLILLGLETLVNL